MTMDDEAGYDEKLRKQILELETNDPDVNQLIQELDNAIGTGEQAKLEPLLDRLTELGRQKKLAFEKAKADIGNAKDPASALAQLMGLKIEFLKLSQKAITVLGSLDRTSEQSKRIFSKIIDYVKEINLVTDEEVSAILSRYGN